MGMCRCAMCLDLSSNSFSWPIAPSAALHPSQRVMRLDPLSQHQAEPMPGASVPCGNKQLTHLQMSCTVISTCAELSNLCTVGLGGTHIPLLPCLFVRINSIMKCHVGKPIWIVPVSIDIQPHQRGCCRHILATYTQQLQLSSLAPRRVDQ